MGFEIKKIEYYNVNVADQIGEAYKILSILEQLGINLQAFIAVPTGPDNAQLTIFPDDHYRLEMESKRANIPLSGPHYAILVKGDDELGALAKIHGKLNNAKVNIFASYGIANGSGGFGYIIYIRPEQIETALSALGI